MKILYLLKNFPKLSETFILNEITQLVNLGHEIHIVAMVNPKEKIVHNSARRFKAHYFNDIGKEY